MLKKKIKDIEEFKVQTYILLEREDIILEPVLLIPDKVFFASV